MKVLRDLRKGRGITQDRLSEQLGVARSTISMWETDACEPDNDTICKIADYFEVSTDFLLGRTDDPVDYENSDLQASLAGPQFDELLQQHNYNVAAATKQKLELDKAVYEDYMREQAAQLDRILPIPGIIPMPKTKKVPLLGDIACGEPILVIENIDEFIDADEDIDCDFALICKGDSMINARIFNGDIVFIRSQPMVENGEIAAVCIDDEATLKRVEVKPNKLVLRAENPMYKDLHYEGMELEQVRILGKAVWFKSRVR